MIPTLEEGDLEEGDLEEGDLEALRGARGARVMGALKAQWWRAMRWRGAVEASLVGSGLTFTQWLVLDATRDLIAESHDAVNQNEVAGRVALSRSNVSFVMRELERKWLVDRGPDLTGRAWRIWVTKPGEQLLGEVAARVEAASWRHADQTTLAPRLIPVSDRECL